MKYAKTFGLLAIMAAAFMAFAGSASATTLTKTNKENIVVDDKLHAVNEGEVALDKINVGAIKCNKSTIEANIVNRGAHPGSPKAHIEKLTFEECGTTTVTVVEGGSTPKTGTLEIHGIAGANGNDGTLTSTGTEFTILTHSFILGTVHCIYKTNATDLGRFTSSRNSGGKATLDIASGVIPWIATDSICKDGATWTGNYEVTAPHYVDVD